MDRRIFTARVLGIVMAAVLGGAYGCSEDPAEPVAEPADPYRMSINYRNWYPASPPLDPSDSGAELDVDSVVSCVWYNIEPDRGGTHRRDLDPNLGDHENTLISTLDIDLDPQETLAGHVWVGLMTGLSPELDLSQKRYLEIWVNDFKPDPQDRGGTLYIEIGLVDEDFFEPENDEWNDEDQERDGFQRIWDDTGLDGMFNANDFRNDAIIREEESGDADVDLHGDDYVFTRIDDRFSKINGTEKNGRHDTEDLDRSGDLNRINSFFRYRIDLASVPEKDIREEHPDYDGFDDPRHANDAWRWYWVELTGGAPVSPGGTSPDLSRARHIRIWWDDVGAAFQDESEPGRRRLQITAFRFADADHQ